ncbi:hypothetical protein GWK08_08055 [Leptobacterium flavescens]|uniref:Uncharacterized protein n=1 Tax=Leptobacterium flavescens TaxID=472055 RepID=A0A6P0USP8_9FLAO|nr:hypothetical protein [Leptobacterium flavescens]NER13386.1 hypothetical protein [Leptobacterium flavescens]
MDSAKLVEQLEEKVTEGKLKKINERNSNNVGVLDGTRSFNCAIIIDIYKDLEGNDLFRIEHNIDQKNNYHTIRVEEFNNGFF